jgi:hypothetical protein
LSKKTCEKYNRPGHIARGILHKNNSYVVEKTAIVVFIQQSFIGLESIVAPHQCEYSNF